MASKNYIINNLISSIQKLTGIGSKSAKRIVLNMLENKVLLFLILTIFSCSNR